MKIRFIGAANGHVTGSCTHFSYARTKTQFLVDCGLHQGEAHAHRLNEQDFPFKPSDIKFVLLTHAHIDHCGLLPKLYRDGFRGSVLCTTATAEFARCSLLDSVQFAEGLYTTEDVKKIRFVCMDQKPNFGLSRFIPIDDDLFVGFTRTAHILGAVSLNISWIKADGSRGTIVMSGDLGNNTDDNPYQPLLAGRQEPFGYPDYIVVESTYGGRTRDPKYSSHQERIKELAAIVRDAVLNSRRLLLPAFSLQRTQEILFDLYCILKTKGDDSIPENRPVLPLFVIDECVTIGHWDVSVHDRLERAITLLPEADMRRWTNAFDATDVIDGTPTKFSLRGDSEVCLEDIRLVLRDYVKPLRISLVVDSPLTMKITKHFAAELTRRKLNDADKPLYRNRAMAQRLQVGTEEEVDDIIREIFPKHAGEIPISIPIGEHKLIYAQTEVLATTYSKKVKPARSQVKTPRQSGTITISSGGMCEGGYVLDHLEQMLPNKLSVILITGYMAPGSLGAKLAEIGRWQASGGTLPFNHIEVNHLTIKVADIKAKVVNIGGYYSGHADEAGLLDFIFSVRKKPDSDMAPASATVFINHGSREARLALKDAIENYQPSYDERHIHSIEMAAYEKWYDLDARSWVELQPSEDLSLPAIFNEMALQQRRTNELLETLIGLLSIGPTQPRY